MVEAGAVGGDQLRSEANRALIRTIEIYLDFLTPEVDPENETVG